jgi:hypothetical protein
MASLETGIHVIRLSARTGMPTAYISIATAPAFALGKQYRITDWRGRIFCHIESVALNTIAAVAQPLAAVAHLVTAICDAIFAQVQRNFATRKDHYNQLAKEHLICAAAAAGMTLAHLVGLLCPVFPRYIYKELCWSDALRSHDQPILPVWTHIVKR